MDEVWRDIPGYVGLYMISDRGRVVSLERIAPDFVMAGVRIKKKIRPDQPGYAGRRGIILCRSNQTQRHQIHRLILQAFVGACPEGMECRHRDGNHLNNVLGNLHWGTHADNMRDKQEHGTQSKGETHTQSKLTEDDVRAIRASNGTIRALADRYGVTSTTVHFIRHRKTWKHVL